MARAPRTTVQILLGALLAGAAGFLAYLWGAAAPVGAALLVGALVAALAAVALVQAAGRGRG